jgi:uncharacterized membrane protein
VGKGRLEAFSDGVIAIIITIMVLELKVPHGVQLDELRPLAPLLLAYAMSFVYVAIYWNNHHHMLHAVRRVDGAVMWANMHLLFWLSLVPFVAGWFGEFPREAVPVGVYGLVLTMCGVAWMILQYTLVRVHGRDSEFAKAVGDDRKGKITQVILVASLAAAFVSPLVAVGLYVVVAMIWLVPDRRFARLAEHV